MPYLFLHWAALVALCVAPVGVAAGLWLALGAGWGVSGGSAGLAGVALVLLLADVLPDPPVDEREVTR